MLLVVATVPGKPDKREELSALLASLAASSRSDAGCASYAFYADVEDQDAFVSIETWDQQSSLDAHMQQPHTQAALGHCRHRRPSERVKSALHGATRGARRRSDRVRLGIVTAGRKGVV